MSAVGSSSALVVGATGLVGGECLKQLSVRPEFECITALTRRALPNDRQTPKLKTVVVDFDRLDDSLDAYQASHLFCALGTTIKQAGTKERFRQVDFGYPLRVAELALAAGVRHLLLVSSIGANPESRGFYLRVKGELEQAVLALGFPAVTIVRPSLLVGDRRELRIGEEIAMRLSWAFPRKYRAVSVRDVARALVDAAAEDRPGIRIIENPEILTAKVGSP